MVFCFLLDSVFCFRHALFPFVAVDIFLYFQRVSAVSSLRGVFRYDDGVLVFAMSSDGSCLLDVTGVRVDSMFLSPSQLLME